MAKLLIFLDGRQENFDPMLYNRGDVVKVVPDNFHFGRKIQDESGRITNPKFQVIHVPGRPEDLNLSQLLEIDQDIIEVEGERSNRPKARRQKKINLAALSALERLDFDNGQASFALERVLKLAVTRG